MPTSATSSPQIRPASPPPTAVREVAAATAAGSGIESSSSAVDAMAHLGATRQAAAARGAAAQGRFMHQLVRTRMSLETGLAEMGSGIGSDARLAMLLVPLNSLFSSDNMAASIARRTATVVGAGVAFVGAKDCVDGYGLMGDTFMVAKEGAGLVASATAGAYATSSALSAIARAMPNEGAMNDVAITTGAAVALVAIPRVVEFAKHVISEMAPELGKLCAAAPAVLTDMDRSPAHDAEMDALYKQAQLVFGVNHHGVLYCSARAFAQRPPVAKFLKRVHGETISKITDELMKKHVDMPTDGSEPRGYNNLMFNRIVSAIDSDGVRGFRGAAKIVATELLAKALIQEAHSRAAQTQGGSGSAS
jgi:hypothetical protein